MQHNKIKSNPMSVALSSKYYFHSFALVFISSVVNAKNVAEHGFTFAKKKQETQINLILHSKSQERASLSSYLSKINNRNNKQCIPNVHNNTTLIRDNSKKRYPFNKDLLNLSLNIRTCL